LVWVKVRTRARLLNATLLKTTQHRPCWFFTSFFFSFPPSSPTFHRSEKKAKVPPLRLFGYRRKGRGREGSVLLFFFPFSFFLPPLSPGRWQWKRFLGLQLPHRPKLAAKLPPFPLFLFSPTAVRVRRGAPVPVLKREELKSRVFSFFFSPFF